MKSSSIFLILCGVVLVSGKNKEEPLNRDTTPFWLRDTLDGDQNRLKQANPLYEVYCCRTSSEKDDNDCSIKLLVAYCCTLTEPC